MGKRSLNFRGNFHNRTAKVEFNLPLISFEEENLHFIYSPALDVTGYGETEEEARSSFEVALGQFFNYTTNKKTLHTELKKLGWNVKAKKSQPPSLVDMINNNKYLQDIFNEKQYRKFDQTVKMPVLA